ncbi:DNA adenine methylase [Leptospira sp. 201903074]|uniref:DNA adenine methylase n=1 Tax=Leptospira abararensis TaxID=2810036 RepID=UPI001966ABCB|nr:DNA adenine methylase [Leptospira abararensis]MBM9547408.1 DNA adenine methylase [Leptospira abararensis]
MHFYSPLRYPGGKGKLSSHIANIFEENLLNDGYYIEPYAGGASVALYLLFQEYSGRILINDFDRSIYAFWYSVLNHTEDLIKLITDTKVNLKNWDKLKQIQINKKKEDLLTLGFSTFYLNRSNRSGIISAGMIGGRQQNGDWKIDARFNKKDLISRIEKIALYRNRIDLKNLDALKLIQNLPKKYSSKSLIYFDPPYYNKGKDLYINHYSEDDHKNVSSKIKQIEKFKWLVTYDSVQPIKKLYKPFRQIEYSINYSASNLIKSGNELAIFSNSLYISKKTKSLFKNKTVA